MNAVSYWLKGVIGRLLYSLGCWLRRRHRLTSDDRLAADIADYERYDQSFDRADDGGGTDNDDDYDPAFHYNYFRN